MKTNVLKAIINATCIPAVKLKEYYNGNGRGTDDASCLKEYIKDCFCSTIREKTDEMRMRKMSSMIENVGDYPFMCVIDGSAVVLNIVEDKNDKITLPEPVCEKLDGKEVIYMTAVVKNGILSGIYAAFGRSYINNIENGTTVVTPKDAFSYLCSLHDDAYYECVFVVDNEIYTQYHMQTRLEIETLAQSGRGLSMQDVQIKSKDGYTGAKLFTVYR